MINSYCRWPALSGWQEELLLEKLKNEVSQDIVGVTTEYKFYIDSDRPLEPDEITKLEWLLRETFQPEMFGASSSLDGQILEVGPRIAIVTPQSTNAVAICQACGLTSITRIERARRYQIKLKQGISLTKNQLDEISRLLFDRMTEEVYEKPLTTFESGIQPEPVKIIPLLEEGISALEKINIELGMALDEIRKNYVYNHFVNVLKRNPTVVELYNFSGLTSEHARHNIFRGQFIIDGVPMPDSLMDMIRETVRVNPGNVEKAFDDNACAVDGHHVKVLMPLNPETVSIYGVKEIEYCIIFKVETHNHPTGVEAYQGAATGTGGLMRDIFAMGRGGLIIAGFACYFVSNLHIPGYKLPWEKVYGSHPPLLKKPLEILIEASNGASYYGNCFGQPIIMGSTTSFEQKVPPGEWIGYTKPGMVAGAIGLIDKKHAKKKKPEKDYLVVQIGGDAYPIGFGGASASSMDAGVNVEELDFASVQRANPEMEQRKYRVIRACSELGDENPIETIQDLGAGGDSIAVPEIVFPVGARIELRKIPCGDKTMTVLVYWCNESQERVVFLIKPESLDLILKICKRERCPVAVIGECTGDGKITLVDEDGSMPVKLGLDFLLADLPKKVIETEHAKWPRRSLTLPAGLTVREALERVLRLVKVGSKGFLTRKVDRSVTGLIAQQQTVGSLQLTMADYAVTADSYLDTTGSAMAIGDQPIKGIVNRPASGRMTIAEALTNLVWAKIESFDSINFSCTWQWPCGQPGEEAELYDTVEAVTELCKQLGLRIPVGKDSLSMTAKTVVDGKPTNIKAPGTLEAVAVAPCPDIRKKVTPDLKKAGKSRLIFIDLAPGKMRLGGSALAQVYEQVGNEVPDVEDPLLLKNSFAVQELIEKGLILAGHDRSEGGLITILLEMAFAGNCGLEVDFKNESIWGSDPMSLLFNEELGLGFEYLPENESAILEILDNYGIKDHSHIIGKAIEDKRITITLNSEVVLDEDMLILRDIWWETSFKLDELQANPKVVREERKAIYDHPGLKFRLTFTPEPTPEYLLKRLHKPRVAILREEGTNGDREMAAAFYLAGFEVWDVTMTDLAEGRVSLKDSKGVAFCGGFSFADVLDAGKGWAGVTEFNERIRKEFGEFFTRPDTFSFGVCNGCQLMALLGVVPWSGIETEKQPRFILNESEIFESRFVTVKILQSNSIFLRGMEGSELGVWVAHKEGRFHYPDKEIFEQIIADNLAPIRFVDKGLVTEQYPFNPNGSPFGITALCSDNERFLAFMEHPERLFLDWQWPYWPEEWKDIKVSPWLRMFQNARKWCEEMEG